MDDAPPAVAITSLEIPFWNLVLFFVKAAFASLIAWAILGTVATIVALVIDQFVYSFT